MPKPGALGLDCTQNPLKMAFVSSLFVGAVVGSRPAGAAAVTARPRSRTCPTSMSMREGPGISRRDALQFTFATAAGTFLFASPSLADHTYVAAKRSFDRYYPRIVAGVEQTREIRSLVRSGAGGSAVAEVVDGKVFDVKLRRALSIYATSFSDNYLGERSRDLLKFVDAFYAEMGEVKKAGNADEGVEHFNKAVNAIENYFEVARLDKSVLKDLNI